MQAFKTGMVYHQEFADGGLYTLVKVYVVCDAKDGLCARPCSQVAKEVVKRVRRADVPECA
jgi:hypothetical protein